VCAGYVPPYMVKHCTVGCFVLCGTWLRIPLKHSSLRAALSKYQQCTCVHTQMIACMSVFVARVGRDSVVCIAICYGLDGPRLESRWGRDFPKQSRPAVGPTMYNEHLVSFPGVKQPGHDVDHLPPPSAEVEERVKLYICSFSGP
jgi:hypothetical protein